MRRILSIDEVRDFRHNESGAWIGANKLDVESIDDPQIPARRNFTLLLPQPLFDDALLALIGLGGVVTQQIAQNIFQQLLQTAELFAELPFRLHAQFGWQVHGAGFCHESIPFNGGTGL